MNINELENMLQTLKQNGYIDEYKIHVNDDRIKLEVERFLSEDDDETDKVSFHGKIKNKGTPNEKIIWHGRKPTVKFFKSPKKAKKLEKSKNNILTELQNNYNMVAFEAIVPFTPGGYIEVVGYKKVGDSAVIRQRWIVTAKKDGFDIYEVQG